MPHADADLAVTLRADPPGTCLITASGELDYHTSQKLRACLDDALLAAGAVLVLDLSGITYCDSTGLSVLVYAHRRAEAAGALFALAGAAPGTFRLLSLAGLSRLFRSYDSAADALRALTA